MDKRVLVVDDDEGIRELIQDVLVPEGFSVATVSSGPEALKYLERRGPVDIAITDLCMHEMDGMELLRRIKRAYPKTDLMTMTSRPSLESALQTMRLGVADCLRKPIEPPEVLYGVTRTMLSRRLVAENESLRGCVQGFEETRVLATCLETSDILPITLDLLLRLLGRDRAVARWVRSDARPGEGIQIQGFRADQARSIRQEVERGKLFDPHDFEGHDSHGSASLQESLASLGLQDDRLLTLPMRHDGRTVGGIWVFSEGRPFDENEQRLAELVRDQAELAHLNAERFLHAREKAFVDDVTDLFNARYLFAALDREVNRADRAGLPLGVLFLDLDRFKLVNDHHGHLVGSRVLGEFGQLLLGSVRAIDTVARYGGDEFCIILVDTGSAGAMQVAERIRQMTQATRFGTQNGLELSITVSVGIANFPANGQTREVLVDQADKAMYLGKSLGRNRVCRADELSSGQ